MAFEKELIKILSDAAKIDEASATVYYFGYHRPGKYNPAQAVWKIVRKSKTGNVWSTEYADGNENYDNIWNNRAVLSYSHLT